MGIYHEIQTELAPFHRKEEHWGMSVKEYFGIVLSFLTKKVILTSKTW